LTAYKSYRSHRESSLFDQRVNEKKRRLHAASAEETNRVNHRPSMHVRCAQRVECFNSRNIRAFGIGLYIVLSYYWCQSFRI